MKKIYSFTLLLMLLSLHAQFTTPNNGEVFTLTDLTLTEPAVVVLSGTNEFSLNGDLTIAENDTLLIDAHTTLKISPNVELSVFGNFNTFSNTEDILITAVDSLNRYAPMRFEEGSDINLHNTVFEYGSGLRTFTENFQMNDCTVRYMGEGPSVSAAVSFSRGNPVVTNNLFYMNDLAAIASGANQAVGAKILNNVFEFNSQLNENRPQINLSAGGQDTLVIAHNIIRGDRSKTMVGGIAVANFFSLPNHLVIEDNEISDNRFGITLMGPNVYALIKDNVIENNDTQGDPMAGGSGINLISSGDALNSNTFVTGNYMAGNLWGVTLQGTAYANFGDGTETSPGLNTFHENGNNGIIFALYNNTPNSLPAQGNCWIAGQESTESQVEDVIFHQQDDSSLGLVDFSGFNCNLAVNDIAEILAVKLYPNPAKSFVVIESSQKGAAEFYNVAGQLVLKTTLNSGQNQISLQLQKGIYFVKIKTSDKEIHKKLLIQ